MPQQQNRRGQERFIFTIKNLKGFRKIKKSQTCWLLTTKFDKMYEENNGFDADLEVIIWFLKTAQCID